MKIENRMKWYKALVPVFFVASMVLSLQSCNEADDSKESESSHIDDNSSEDNSSSNNSSGETPVGPDEKEYPEDKGPFISYRMEAENAIHNIANGGSFKDYSNVRFDLRLSGGLATSNMNTVGTTHTFNFSSDKSFSNVALKMLVGGYPEKNLSLSDFLAVKVNDENQNLRGLTVKYTDCDLLGQSEYMIFKLVTLFIDIKEGANKIVLEHTGVSAGNLDYIELETSAKITDWTDIIADTTSIWEVTKEPTTMSEGEIKVTSGSDSATYSLPVLAEDNGYTIVSKEENNKEYSFVLKGKRFAFEAIDYSNVFFDVTVRDGTVDGKTVGSYHPGDTLNLVYNGSAPDSRTVIGWYNVDDTKEFYSGNSLTMPIRNITLAPVLSSKGTYAVSAGNNTLQPIDQADKFDVNSASFEYDSVVVNDEDGFAVIASAMKYSDTLTTDARFRIKSIYDGCDTSGAKKATLKAGSTFYYSFRNDGTEKISFSLTQVNTKLTPLKDASGTDLSKEFALEVGDSASASFTLGEEITNNSLLSLFYMKEATTKPLELSIALSYTLAE